MLQAEITKLSSPDVVQSAFGEWNFFDGVPTADSVTKIYDALDFLRGVDVFMNCVPGASVAALRKGQRAIGQTSARQICIADPRALFLQEWFDQTWKLNEFELIG
jgi:hypothetical protein